MKRTKWVTAAAAVALVPAALLVVSALPGNATENSKFTAKPLSVASRISATKNPTSRLAKTDPALLGRKDSKDVQVVIKLGYDPLTTYAGDVNGFAATSPTVTGRKLSGSAVEKKYASHVTSVEDAFVAQLKKKVPAAKVGRSLQTVYGGIAASVPANKIADVLTIPGVVAVQSDALRKPLTDASASFIGATSLYPQLGGDAKAGKGVIFGVLDTGAWPEHPSFADKGLLSAPPAKADGTARACDFGDNPLTAATDVFACNNKLIGGKPFLQTYLADPGRAAAETYKTARDSNGHGTHTGSTSAGNKLASATVLGVERGPLNGIAPGAWVSVYKVCGAAGCFSSDSAAAVQQAILDGVSVINFSISGGVDPFTDPVELAFLDAYAAGVFVSASAGNDGPGASTANHLSPWVTTVAASTQKREFDSTLTVTSGADTATFHGASITSGVGPLPVVFASAAPYSDNLCTTPAAAGTFTGKIVACQRGGNARVDKGFNVKQGGAAGMILFNATLADIETDNHWLPTVHLADGTAFNTFATAHSGGFSATFTAGQKLTGAGDAMAAFSSRGPAGQFIKPDVTAPGVQILAGHTPTPETSAEGPQGEYFQAIAGTSMSSPHTAGSAVLIKALHPTWTPGQIKSALMTTATTNVVKEDLTTPADPFDLGAGRIALAPAGNPGLTFDETAARMAAIGGDPLQTLNLNIPSLNAPIMPGSITTTRVAKNVTTRSQSYRVTATAPAGSSITVSPTAFTVGAGKTVTLKITIKSTSPGQKFGQINLTPRTSGVPRLHLPVAFVSQQGSVKLASECAPTSVAMGGHSTCTITATNDSFADTTADLKTETGLRLPITGATGATKVHPFKVEKKGVALNGAIPGVPSIAAGDTPAGPDYLPLGSFGIPAEPVGDEDALNYNVPAFVFNGVTYTSLGITSNGYVVAGGATAEDVVCCTLPAIPSPSRPNNLLAPFWTDLDGTGAPGVRIGILGGGGSEWLVVEWNVFEWGTTSERHFQTWIGLGATQDISFAYDPAALPTAPADNAPFQVGAENVSGAGGAGLGLNVLPTQNQVITSSAPTAGGSVSYTVDVMGLLPGTGTVKTSLTSPAVAGTTIVTSTVDITK